MDKMKMEILSEEDGKVVLRCSNAVIRRMMNPMEEEMDEAWEDSFSLTDNDCGLQVTDEGGLIVTDEILEALENCFPPEESTPMPGEPGFHWGL